MLNDFARKRDQGTKLGMMCPRVEASFPFQALLIASWVLLWAVTGQVDAATAQYSPPVGGWTYLYAGDQGDAPPDGAGFLSLDGTWSHDNDSDAWDGSGIGGEFGFENRPGGVEILTEGDTTFIRVQDSGDPRDHDENFEFGDPGSNRKIFFLHRLDGQAETALLDEGLTLTFRARVPAGEGLDPVFANDASATAPYPADGDGALPSDDGKGQIVVHQASGGSIAWSLATRADLPRDSFEGLIMNSLNGDAPSPEVDIGESGEANRLALNPRDWHEFWVTIQRAREGQGTHEVRVYLDGSGTPEVFRLTAGTGSDLPGASYLAFGLPSTSQSGALDLDFLAFREGVHEPDAESEPGGPLVPTVAYDNSVNYQGQVVSPGNGVEFGDEIQMTDAGRVVQFTFQYFASSNLQSGTGILRFRRNDGSDLTIEGEVISRPGTVFFSSSSFPLAAGFQAVEVDLSESPVDAPQSFTWTFEVQDVNEGASAGLLIFSPPVVGESADYFWEITDGTWESYFISGGLVDGTFGAVVTLGLPQQDRSPLEILAPRVAGNDFSFSFSGEAGASYRVERANSVDGPWEVFETFSPASDALIEVSDPIGSPLRFYRVRVD